MQIVLKLAAKTKKGTELQAPKEKDPFVEEAVPTSFASKSPAPVGSGRRILVVDDNPVVLKAFELKLRASGFTVATLLDAAAVVNAAEETAAELIILDINFPASANLDWNGYTSVQWLQRFPKLAAVPVILISGEDVKQHQARALAAGAVAFFQKPVPYPELLTVIVRALGISA